MYFVFSFHDHLSLNICCHFGHQKLTWYGLNLAIYLSFCVYHPDIMNKCHYLTGSSLTLLAICRK